MEYPSKKITTQEDSRQQLLCIVSWGSGETIRLKYTPEQQKVWYRKNKEEFPEIKAMLESEQRFEIVGVLRRMPQNFTFRGLPEDVRNDYLL